jgi:hypothetical protein
MCQVITCVNYELRDGGLQAVSRGFTIVHGSLFLKLRRQGQAFSAWYSHDGRRWIELGRVDATFPQRAEVGVVAVNSSEEALPAELEMLNVEDPRVRRPGTTRTRPRKGCRALGRHGRK